MKIMQKTIAYNSSSMVPNRNHAEPVIFWIVISLFWNGYSSGIPGVSLGSLILCFVCLYCLLVQRTCNIAFEILVIFCGILFFSCCGLLINIQFISGFHYRSLISSTTEFMKLALWFLFAGIISLGFYEFEIMRKWMIRFSTILTVYIYIQSIAFYFFGVYLPNIFNFGILQPYAEGYANYEVFSQSRIIRPAGFLSESAFYGNVVLATIVLYLNDYLIEVSAKKNSYLAFLAIGIFLSGSTSAIVCLGGVVVAFLIRIKAPLIQVVAILIAILLVILIIGFWDKVVELGNLGYSIEYAFAKFSNLENLSRFGKSYGYLLKLPMSVLLFGVGLGFDNAIVSLFFLGQDVYLNSVTSFILQFGCLGFVFFSCVLFYTLIKSVTRRNFVSFSIIAIYYVKGFASGIYFSTYGLLFMFIAIGALHNYRQNR